MKLKALIIKAFKVFLLSMFILVLTVSTFAQEHFTEDINIIKGIYDSFATGNIPAVLDAMDPNIEWNAAENFPYADGNPYIGPTAVLEGVIYRLGSEWEYWTFTDIEFHQTKSNKVLVTGRYNSKYKKTGCVLNAQFAHLWRLENGKVIKFQQYTDTQQANTVMNFINKDAPNLTYKEIIGKTLIYDFGNVCYAVIISSDSTLYWRDLRSSSASEGNEKSKTVQIDNYKAFISWIESDETRVALLSDFSNGNAIASVYTIDGNIIPLKGIIKLN